MTVDYVAGAYSVAWATNPAYNLGYTKEGLIFSIEDLFKEIKIDRLGDSIYDLLITGKKVTITIPSLKWDANTLAVLASSGSLGGTTNIGMSALDVMARLLVLTPLTGNANDAFYCWKAVNRKKLDFPLATAPRILPFEFLLLPDMTKTEDKTFFERRIV